MKTDVANKCLIIMCIAAIIGGVFFRLNGLGYSDFQGDEVAAQNFLFDERPFFTFLLTRTIGPGQYIVAYLANKAFIDQSNLEGLLRLPFAIANILSLFYLYKLVKTVSKRQTALVAVAIASLLGLLIAFARIVQYQSFILLFATLSIYIFALYLQKNEFKYIIAAGITSCLGILFHYDALSFSIPILGILLLNKNVKGLSLYGLIAYGIPAVFYSLSFLGPTGVSTLTYIISERIGDEFGYDSLYYSIKLLKIYHPKESLIILTLGLICILNYLVNWLPSRRLSWGLFVFALISLVRVFIVIQSPILIVISSITVLLTGLSIAKHRIGTLNSTDVIPIWFLFSFFIYGTLITKPLTHIYTFIYPLVALIALSIERNKRLQIAFTVVILTAAISFNYQAFVDTTPEYPWQNKHYIFGRMETPLAYQQEIKGVFGFPYNRKWKNIKTILKASNKKTYASNEKYRLAKYYIRGMKYTDNNPEVFVYIKGSQSLSNFKPIDYKEVLDEPQFSIYYINSLSQ